MKRRMTSIYKKNYGWFDFKKDTADIIRSNDLYLWNSQHPSADKHHRGGCHLLNAFHWALAKNLSSIHYPRIGYSLLFAGI